MGYRKCCVTDCKSTSETHCVHRFPRNKDLQQLWMSYLVPHNSSLLMLTEDQLLNKTVCQLHFERRMFDANGVKMSNAYPCLFSKNEISHGAPLLTGPLAHEEHSYAKKEDDVALDPISSDAEFILRPEESVEHLYQTCLSNNESASTESTNLSSTLILPTSSTNQDTSSTLAYNTKPHLILPSTSTNQDTSSTPAYNTKPHKALSTKRKMSAKNRRLASKIINMAHDSLGENNATRTQQAQALLFSDLMNEFHKLNHYSKTFIMLQLKSVRSERAARRYDLNEKLLCLNLMKQSRKNYKLLQHMFLLPSPRTLSRVSEKIVFDTGINDNIMAVIKEKSKKWNTEKRLCSIVFDEVSINTQLNYNEEKDVINGFCDIAGERKMKFCDHALVLMIRGVCSSWRQPLAYYFCEGTTSAADIKKILKEAVSKISQSGLIPITLICDQGSTFRTALKQLREETIRNRIIDKILDDGTIHIAGHDVSVIYDPPHLIKGIRNNFLTKDIIYKSKIASWNDIVTVYEIDNSLGNTRAMPKITKHHIDKDSMRKMRVSIATQVLSARVSAMLRYTDAVAKRNDGGPLSSTMATTADVVEFFDSLFDSVNGSPGNAAKGKLRSAVKINSKHIPFWHNAIKTISEIKFRDKNGQNAYVPSLRGWITTLESFIRIAKLLFSKYGVTYFYPRFLNQDPLENFFGRLRAFNYRNVIPDANAFINTFKSLVLTNVLSPLSKFSNCEEDEGDQILCLESLFTKKTNKVSTINEENKENISPNVPSTSGSFQSDIPPVILEKMKVHCSSYVAGFICRKINKVIKCNKCQKIITTHNISSIHKYILYREYKTLKNSNLVYPSEKFLLIYRKCSQIVHNYLNKFCHKKNVKLNLKEIFKYQCNLEWMGCNAGHKEKLKDLFSKIIIRLQVHNWVKIINKILRGAIEEKFVLKMEVPQVEALNKYKKNRRRSKIKK